MKPKAAVKALLDALMLLALLFCSIVLVTANNYQGFIYAQF